MKKDFKYREIPYNYTSFSDREIVSKYLDTETWDLLGELRGKRVTGRSARLLFEVIGDIFIVDRNPYIYNDLLENSKKLSRLKRLHRIRIDSIESGTESERVKRLVEKTKEMEKRFFAGFSTEKKKRARILLSLSRVISRKNVFFSAYHKVTHSTDATDWRVEYPEVVVYPENVFEVRGLIRTAKKLGLKIVPRGGGTGLTGGAVPVYKNTMVINTEKLRNIGTIENIRENGIDIPVIETEAGVITETVMHYCKENGFVFATDPTSAWASTIGGNISENCGGKKAVIWGTAIDNLYSFRIIDSSARILEVQRRNHPYRKIVQDDTVIFDVYNIDKKKGRELVKSIELSGTDIRKKGVGKDITNKALGGLPGVQKEGGDGVIVSARFVLYRPFTFCRTICLEFFGNNLINASKAIVDILAYFDKGKKSYLTALEHFDEKYVAAINYRNKSDRGEVPKAVLLVDIEGNDEKSLNLECAEISKMVIQYNTESFIASEESAREAFWKDRKNLGAISKHTNAFKLNEDVVIPIESLPQFADFIEMLNMQKELQNSAEMISDIKEYLNKFDDIEDSFLKSKIETYIGRIVDVDTLCRLYTENLDKKADEIPSGDRSFEDEDRTIFELIREKEIKLNIDQDVINNFRNTFHGYVDILSGFDEIVAHRRGRKIIIATHMHAGDGNIHVNIPVHSNDYSMMLEADETAGIVMRKTTELGGVISGEHGIGLTKLKFIDQNVLDDYAAYKKDADPDDLFNPGKLRSDFPTNMIYTPSLNLLKMEAFILEAADLKDLTNSISACVRCGKCKEVCNTHYPAGTMFYSPRNKILGVSLITEAVLYEAQTENTMSFRNFRKLQEISDHCTMCHNCLKPCPVSIDFGEVTLAVRKLMVDRKRKKFKPVTWFTLYYLRKRGYYINKVFRMMLLNAGYSGQRAGHYMNKFLSGITNAFSPYINAMLRSKLPKAGSPSIRDVFGLKGNSKFFSFHDRSKTAQKSVVYFPGCGSERMFSDISFAVIALLYNAGVRVVIPPEYLCCGYPMLANGKTMQAENKSYENRVIFHRMADTVSYMGIENVIVSCGTCLEMLGKYQMENIFENSSVVDINEFIAKEGFYSVEHGGERLLYHDPCHSPVKKYGVNKLFKALTGNTPVNINNCCGEGGTLALSTPEIANILRERKSDNILDKFKKREKAVVVTTCPSCVQGLSRIDGKLNVEGKALAVYLAEKNLGRSWKKDFIRDIRKNSGLEEIIM